MANIYWKSWSSDYAQFELNRLPKLTNWVDGNKKITLHGGVWLTANGNHYRDGNFMKATIYFEPYIYSNGEFDNFQENRNKWDIRFTYNLDFIDMPNTRVIHFPGYWNYDGKNNFNNTIKDTTFGMVLSYKPPPIHKTDIGYLRNEIVNKLINKSFKQWGYWPHQHPNHMGQVFLSNDKFFDAQRLLSTCKFGFAVENSLINGYTTEKIWTCLLANTVPIYYGHKSVFNIIPANCFIYGLDDSMDNIIKRCETMPDEEYQQYRQNIKEFINYNTTHSWEFMFNFIDRCF